MPHRARHRERHLVRRIGLLRAAVLGANDGIVSVGSLIVGVAASAAGRSEVLIAGCAALVAGAMSMAAGEYVSVSSQADTEQADLARERVELQVDPQAERHELAGIYRKRGVDAALADRVAEQLMARDALGAHAKDELGISEISTARPIQAALTSAVTFTCGAVVPLAVGVLAPQRMALASVAITSVLLLAVLGALGASMGGANIGKAVLRVTFWGLLAMLVTGGIGRLVGSVV